MGWTVKVDQEQRRVSLGGRILNNDHTAYRSGLQRAVLQPRTVSQERRQHSSRGPRRRRFWSLCVLNL